MSAEQNPCEFESEEMGQVQKLILCLQKVREPIRMKSAVSMNVMGLLVAALACVSTSHSAARADDNVASQPNIVVILADDIYHQDSRKWC